MQPAPAISVLLPVHNAGKYLRVALASLAAQTFSDFEVIAVDDGSTDGSGKVLDAHASADPRFRVIHQPKSGIVAALNAAIAAARAPLCARMDGDDIAEPGRFAAQVAFLRERQEVVGLGTSVIVMDAAGRPVKRMPRKPDHASIDADLLHGDGGALIHPSTMFRTASLRAIHGYRKEAEYKEDLDLYLRLAEIGPLANLSEYLLRYRVHLKSVNFTVGATRDALVHRIIEDACRRRGVVATVRPDLGADWRDPRKIHRDWAITSLEFGGLLAPLAHALRALSLVPRDPQSWRTLSYVIRALVRRRRRGVA